MSVKANLRKMLSKYLEQHGYEIVPTRSLYEWQKLNQPLPSYKESPLPEGAKTYLNVANQRLKELEVKYDKFDAEVTSHLVWKEGHVRPDDLLYFRGDNAYVYQLRGSNMNILGYALTTYYVKSTDKLGLMEKLEEDDYFGNYTFLIDTKKVSRDLLDSINEIYFLEKHLEISKRQNLKILDIGAGYGRLAHRMLKALPNIKTYYCTDAVAVSTFISEYYLRFRKLEDRSRVIPLENIEDTLKNEAIDVALNIHSFSECSIEAVDWWISLLKKNKVRYLMIVPNIYTDSKDKLVTHDRQDISKVLEKYNYKLLIKEPKFCDPVVQQYGINPTQYYLFELD
jgi:hypothetical protein